MSLIFLRKQASDFVSAYLSEIRYMASVIPQRDRGYFPQYWFGRNIIIITCNENGDVAIRLGRWLKKKEDSFRFETSPHRIEEAVFPRLDYSLRPAFFNITGHHWSVGYMTLVTNLNPFFTLQEGADVKIMDVRFESTYRVRGYPAEKTLLWLFRRPSEERMSKDEAKKEAAKDFRGYIQWLVFTRFYDILGAKLLEETLALFRKSVKQLAAEYEQLITREDLEEEELQMFLEKHYFLLSPEVRVIKEKRKLGPYIPDFILRYSDGSFALVEIQLNRDPIFLDDGPSEGMKEAVEQMRNWFDWVRRYSPCELARASGLIVIGRRSSYIKHHKKVKDLLNTLPCPVKLLTYDDLGDAFNRILNLLS